MHHEMLTQHARFCIGVNARARATEAAFRDACHTSSGFDYLPHLTIESSANHGHAPLPQCLTVSQCKFIGYTHLVSLPSAVLVPIGLELGNETL